ncbi:MAG: hypothetical protein M0T86_04970 [Betaproteobacteria bacterium]|nr:hypothetical protein [Betaproteobacteria bacterium]
MPYFICKLQSFNRVEPLEQFDQFKDASSRAKAFRKDMPADADYTIKVIFAETALAVEDVLNAPRAPGITTGEDY